MKKLAILLLSIMMMFTFGVACGQVGGSESLQESSNSILEDSSSSGQEEVVEYTIRFVQEGTQDIVRKVKEGQALTDIPSPVAVAGYDIAWNVTDFSRIEGDVTVIAIKTPKTYTITYLLGELAEDPNAVISTTEQDVKYKETFTLVIPTCTRYAFKHWVITGTETIFNGGTYTRTSDVSLTAVWEIVEEDFWTGQH